MKNIKVVIGAGYGDEGKGLTTDWLSWRYCRESAVVRFNGGAQAGHGVQLSDKFRHVFHTLGSGTLNGSATILGRRFIVNPALFWIEAEELTQKLLDANKYSQLPAMYIDPRCIITTPFEMEINQAQERQRGDERHGSCGVGIGETVERESRGFSLTIQDVLDGNLEEKLTQIENEYVPERVSELGIDDVYVDVDINTFNNFISDTEDLVKHATIIEDYKAVQSFENVIFEGAQGLFLDEDSKDFPHVTRSKTGMKNVVEILEDCNNVTPVDVYYVTRAYSTRHGAGLLNGEITDKAITVEDKTNVPNEFQGSMRYAKLDTERVKSEIYNDIKQCTDVGIGVNANLLVTHCDQLHKVTDQTAEEVVENLMPSKYIYDNIRTSWGPTKFDILYGVPEPLIK